MALPCVLFSSSSSEFKPKEFVKQILRVSELPQPKFLSDCIESYEWFFETKYYRTTVHLCTTDNRTIGDKEFAESVQAFVHFFDPNEPSSFELAKAWLPYLSHIEPDVLMLVCNTSKHNDAVGRGVTLEWCIQNGFELVELDPENDNENEDEDDFPETTGIARIIQALHAHTWPNLDMKDSPTVQSPYLRQMMKEQHLLNKKEKQNLENQPSSQQPGDLPHSNHSDSSKDISNSSASQGKEHHLSQTDGNSEEKPNKNATSEQSLPGVSSNENSQTKGEATASSMQTPQNTNSASADLTGDVPLDNIDWRSLMEGAVIQDEDEMGADEFEQLFMKLKVMKDRAEGMPQEERKKYAEKVAIQFWKAIGGDDDEIEGLDFDQDSG